MEPGLAEWIVDQLRERMVEGDEAQVAIDPEHRTVTAMINWRPVLSLPITDGPPDGRAASS